MTTSLYDLAAEFRALEDAAVAAEGESSPALDAAFAALGELEASKVDSYRHVIRILEGRATDLAVEIELLQSKRRAADTAVARLKARLLDYMRARGVTELAGHLFRATVQRNGGKPSVLVTVSADDLPPAYVVMTRRADVEALRALADETGAIVIRGVTVGQVEAMGEHLRFR